MDAHRLRLECVCSSVVPLGLYYASFARRTEWEQKWRSTPREGEMLKGEKLKRSLAVWMPKMDLGNDDSNAEESSGGGGGGVGEGNQIGRTSDRHRHSTEEGFLVDLLSLVFSFWKEHSPPSRSGVSAPRKGGNKGKRR